MAQGRKWYLHARSEVGARPWETGKQKDGLKQKARVEPLSAGQPFFFHVDFDNLSDVEFGLLLYALEPDTDYHHKLGMGKPLGLGSVKIEPLAYFPVSRQRRYSLEGLRAGRTPRVELTAAGKEARGRDDWPARYTVETGSAAEGAETLSRVREIAMGTGFIPVPVRKALAVLGSYKGAPLAKDVHYPTNADQRDKEAEHYKWFMFNDGQKEHGRTMTPSEQYLKPLESEKVLPELTELEWGS